MPSSPRSRRLKYGCPQHMNSNRRDGWSVFACHTLCGEEWVAERKKRLYLYTASRRAKSQYISGNRACVKFARSADVTVRLARLIRKLACESYGGELSDEMSPPCKTFCMKWLINSAPRSVKSKGMSCGYWFLMMLITSQSMANAATVAGCVWHPFYRDAVSMTIRVYL